jgi:hypothetical protein
MTTVANLPSGVLLSIRQFADETGVDRETVAKRVKASSIAPAAKRGGHPVFRLRDLLQAAYVTDEEGALDPDRLKPFERHAFYKAEREKLQLQVERAELVSSLEAEQKFAALFKAIAEFFDTLPDVLERDCGLNPMMLAKLEDRLDALREQLYGQVTDIGDIDADGAAQSAG